MNHRRVLKRPCEFFRIDVGPGHVTQGYQFQCLLLSLESGFDLFFGGSRTGCREEHADDRDNRGRKALRGGAVFGARRSLVPKFVQGIRLAYMGEG